MPVGLKTAAVGDFNGDHKLDLALNFANGNSGASILLGNGDGTFSTTFWGCLFWNRALAAGDLNRDGKLDLVLQNSIGALQIYLGKGDGTFSYSHSHLDTGNTTVAIADLNNDGQLDIAASNGVLLGSGTGTFAGMPLSLVPLGTQVIADFDENGTQDIAEVGTNSVYILSNDGTGVMSLIHTYTLQQPSYSIARRTSTEMETSIW